MTVHEFNAKILTLVRKFSLCGFAFDNIRLCKSRFYVKGTHWRCQIGRSLKYALFPEKIEHCLKILDYVVLW